MKTKLGRTLFITIFLLLIASAIPLSLIYNDINNSKNEEKSLTAVNFPPSFVTSPPSTATVGEEFNYRIRVSDSETPEEELTVELVEVPLWLIYDGDSLIGSPVEDDIGSARVDISVSDGENTVHQEFYIVVSADAEDI